MSYICWSGNNPQRAVLLACVWTWYQRVTWWQESGGDQGIDWQIRVMVAHGSSV